MGASLGVGERSAEWSRLIYELAFTLHVERECLLRSGGRGCRGQGLERGRAFELHSQEIGVAAAVGHELVVGAGFDDAAVFDHGDEVGVADGAEAVGDDEAGAAGHETREAPLDEALGLGVEVAGGLVEDQDFRIGEDGAGDGEALLLAAREADAPLAYDGVVALLELFDEAGGVGLGRGVGDLGSRGVAPGVADVFGDGAVEEEDILLDDAQEAASLVWG